MTGGTGGSGGGISTIPPASGPYGAYSAWIGATELDDFPVTAGAAQPTRNPGEGVLGREATVALIAQQSDGALEVQFATYLGGSARDEGLRSTVDAEGSVYVVGDTESTDFPLVNPLQPELAGPGDCFVTKYDASGAMLFSTYLGGSDYDDPAAVAVDDTGLYIVGRSASPDFPTTAGTVQPTFGGLHEGFLTSSGGGDMFVTKLALDGSQILWSTYIGGRWSDSASDLYVDASGTVFVAGSTDSDDFPTTPNAYQSTINGMLTADDGLFFNSDSVVLKLSSDGSTLEHSTLMGGGESDFGSVVLPLSDGSLLLGGTYRSPDFPNASAPTLGDHGGFLARFSGDASTLISVLQLNTSEAGWVDKILATADATYIAGTVGQTGMADDDAAQASFGGVRDGYLARLSADYASVEHFTYVGGEEQDSLHAMGVDGSGRIHLALMTQSPDLVVKGHDGSYHGSGFDSYWVALQPDGSRIDFAGYLGVLGQGAFFSAP